MRAFREFAQEELKKATSELVQQFSDGHKCVFLAQNVTDVS